MTIARDAVEAAWLESLPDILASCAARWKLRIGEALTGGYSSRVFACTDAGGNQLVLKLASPAMPAALEAAALRLWAGRCAAAVRDVDPAAGALLLERIFPGTPLPAGNDWAAITVAAEVLAGLHTAPLPANHPFPPLAQAFERFHVERARRDAEPGTVGLKLLAEAHAAARRLCSTTGEAVLLHGDFLDKNLLLGPDGYHAIDPMPCAGDPCSDIGFFTAGYQPARGIRPRAHALAGMLGRDPERSERWAAVWAVGEACETWREDSDELQVWVGSDEVAKLLI